MKNLNLKISKEWNGLYYIATSHKSISEEIGVDFSEYIKTLEKEYNACLSIALGLGFNSRRDANRAVEWIESRIVMKKLIE